MTHILCYSKLVTVYSIQAYRGSRSAH